MHYVTRACQSHWRKNFLPHVHYVATIPCESVRHKSNTFHTILALCTNQYRWNKQNTAESQRRKIYIQNVHHSREHMHSNDYAIAQSQSWWRCAWSSSLHSLSWRYFNSFMHIMDSRTVDPPLKDLPDTVVHRIQIWRIGWPHLWRDKLLASLSAAWWLSRAR